MIHFMLLFFVMLLLIIHIAFYILGVVVVDAEVKMDVVVDVNADAVRARPKLITIIDASFLEFNFF